MGLGFLATMQILMAGRLFGAFRPSDARAPLRPTLNAPRPLGKGHGRIEVHCLAQSRARQRCACADSAQPKSAVSSGYARAGPDERRALIRRRRGIENRLRYRGDVALREDASRIPTGAAPQVLAALRNAVLRLVHPLWEPLAENRLEAVAAVKDGVLRNCAHAARRR